MSPKRPIPFTALVVTLLLMSGIPLAFLPSTTAEDGLDGPWSLPVRVDDGKHTGASITSVRLVEGPDGSFHTAWMDERYNGTDTFTSHSTDGGEAWNGDVMIDPFENQARLTPTTCDVEVDGDGKVYVTYTQWMLQQGWWRVRFARSDDGGATFRDPSDAFFVVDDALAQEHPVTAISTHGSLNILYLDKTQISSKLFLVRSDDGLNPLPPRVVEPGMPGNESHVQGDIAMDGDDNVYVAFGYRAPGEAGIKLAKMVSGSGNFVVSKVHTVTEDAPRSLRPVIAVHDDLVEIAFDPLEADNRIVHVRSEDGGATFGPPSKVWGGGGANDAQTNPDLAFDILGRIHVAWAQGEAGKTRVRHSLSHDGVTFTAPIPLTGGWNESEMGQRLWEDHPAIVPLEDGGVVAAFAASLNRTVGVYFVRMENLPPEVSITVPADGAQVRGTVHVQGTAVDTGGTTGLEAVYIQVGDGAPKRLAGTTEWEHTFDSTDFPEGDLTISAWASDGFVKGPVTNVTVDVDNNRPPVLNLAKPVNGTTYVGFVPVDGTVDDEEGFDKNTTKVQWKYPDDTEWTDSVDWELQTDKILDFDFELDLSHLTTGPAAIQVRVSDGDKWSTVSERTFEMENKPDLVLETSGVSIDIAEPEHKDVVTISVTVTNEGAGASGLYDVEFRRFNNFEGMTTGRNLSVGEGDTLTFVWEAVKGDNTLVFTVDPQFKIAELDKDNNRAEIQVKVKAPPPEEDDETDYMFIIAIIVVVAVIGIGGVVMYMKYWAAAPGLEQPEVQVVYEGGGMYSDSSAEYTGADTSGRELMQQAGDQSQGPDLDTPDLDSKDPEQLTEDVDIRPEKVERA